MVLAIPPCAIIHCDVKAMTVQKSLEAEIKHVLFCFVIISSDVQIKIVGHFLVRGHQGRDWGLANFRVF